MKLLKKISIGSINSVRGGLKDVKGRMLVMVIAGICGSYKEKVSETMGVSYAFLGEFRAIDRNGEESAAPVAYLPEPAQSLLKTQIDDLVNQGGGNVEFGFRFWAVEDATAIKGYVFEVEPLMEARASTALERLTTDLGVVSAAAKQAQLGHDKPEKPAEPTPAKAAAGTEVAADKGKHGKR